MPSCAIISCRSRNAPNCGIGFYRFPRKPRLIEKWLAVTGRNGWTPKKTSTICSKHFSEDDFLVTPCKDRKYLRSDSVPHIDVCKIVENDKGCKAKNGTKTRTKKSKNGGKRSLKHENGDTLESTFVTSKLKIEQMKDEQEDSEHDDDEDEKSSNERSRSSSPSLSGETKQSLKRIINTDRDVIKRQRRTIMALRSANRRYKAKIEKMEEVLEDLQKEILKWLPE